MKRTQLLPIVCLLAGFCPAMRAQVVTDCATMLKPLFDFAAARSVQSRLCDSDETLWYGVETGRSGPRLLLYGEVVRHLNVVTFPTTQDFRGV